jgi:hypothetical protein
MPMPDLRSAIRFSLPAMRRAAGLLCLCALVLAGSARPASAQSCTVIHVRGTVWTSPTPAKSPDAALAPGTRLSSSDTLRFQSADDRALALCPEKGRVVFRPRATEASSTEAHASAVGSAEAKPSWVAIVAQILAEPYGIRDLGTRGVPRPDTLRTPLDLQRHFGPDRYLMLGAYEVPVAGDLRQRLDAGDRLALTFHDSSTQTLPYAGGQLRISSDRLLPSTGPNSTVSSLDAPRPSSAVLHWHSGGVDSGFITALRPVAPPPDRVGLEVRALAQALGDQGRSAQEIRDEVYAFLRDTYGTPYLPFTERWLSTHLDRP